ncbi:MAG: type VII secretion protein EssC [Bacilli bacterium]
MEISLLLSTKIVKFNLPVQVFGNFSFDENEEEEAKLINIESENNNWFLVSTTSVSVYNGKNDYTSKVLLEKNRFYILQREANKYLIYTSDTYDNTFTKYRYNEQVNIVMGSTKNCNIYYNLPYIKDIAFTINYSNNLLNLKSNRNNLIYINNKAVNKDISIINAGDVIEIFGLKIIILNGIILINNPNNEVFINKLTAGFNDLIVNSNDNLINNELKELNLYNDDDYFSKAPRINRNIEHKDFKIDSPPTIKDEEEMPFLLEIGPRLAMAMMSLASFATAIARIASGNATIISQLSPLIMGISMLSATLLWPQITKKYKKKKRAKQLEKNKEKYCEYLKSKRKEIETEIKLQSDILTENLISNENCYDIALNKKTGLWSRRVEQPDFLKVRIGIGDYPADISISCPQDGFSVEEDVLKEEAMQFPKTYEYLKDVPIGYSLTQNKVTAIMGSKNKTYNFIKNIILQLATFHSFEDLKIVVFTNNENESNWNFIKNFPHNFDNNKKIRFYATDSEESKEIANYLDLQFKNRCLDENMHIIERNYMQCRPYYVIITDNYSKIRTLPILKSITEVENNYGFSLVLIENRLSKLPSKCDNFISIGDSSSSVLEGAYNNQKIINFHDEINYEINMNLVGKRLSNIPIEFDGFANKALPNMITFLEMENVGKVEQLNIINRWKNNDPTKSLKAEIGVDEAGDLLYLDLHEKAHGPHGLIAGMTGSGKSEFIISYVLSMAINYSPNEVAFILIDYKGGGLAGAFENKATGIKLPHLAGTITNLDKAEMNRTLVSIDSEVRRRQRVFNEARDKLGESTIDIYKYQAFYREGKLDEPVPHLIIICDEFAELKSQQPDFMNNLISVARIGRSLGVHLILATQKPSGVVNDQIWSNSKFRVCLKVQEKEDSNEMLKRPDAASLKQVGRFYLQVGYNELFLLGQSAWCGAKYFPSDKVEKNVDKTIEFINNIGYVIKSVRESVNKKGPDCGEQLANILKHIIDAGKMEKMEAKRLWLDNIPSIILINNLIIKYNLTRTPNFVDAIIGEYDDPSNQRQSILKINLNNNGNTIIYGNIGSDKEMVLDAIIYSTAIRYTTSEINYYIVDYGSEALRKFINFPHIGDIVFLGEEEKLNNLFKLIRNIIRQRKQLFAQYGGEYNNYVKNSNKSIPLIGIIVNNYDSFIENNPNVEDELIKFTRDGLRYGVFFILTANNDNSVRRKISQNFNSTLALRLNDISDYANIYGRVNRVPKDIDGRGLVKLESIYEFQTASITEEENSSDIIRQIGINLTSQNNYNVQRIPTLPNTVTLEYVSSYLKGINSVPIGVYKQSLDIVNYDFTSYLATFILSNTSENTATFSKALISELIKIQNLQVIVVDINKELAEIKGIVKYYYDSNPEKVINLLMEYVEKIKTIQSYTTRTLIYFQNIAKLKSKVEESSIEKFTKLIKGLENINIIVTSDYKQLKKSAYETWYKNIQNDTDGIWIGTGLSEQNIFKISKITKEMGARYKNNFGFVIKDGMADIFKTIELKTTGNDEGVDDDE